MFITSHLIITSSTTNMMINTTTSVTAMTATAGTTAEFISAYNNSKNWHIQLMYIHLQLTYINNNLVYNIKLTS